MAKFSFYKNGITNLVPDTDITLARAIARVRSDEFKDDIERLRKSTDASIRKTLKNALSYFTISGTFKKRIVDGLIKHSGLLIIDFDHLPDVDAARRALQADNLVAACFISPSGDGLKVIVKIDGKKHLESFLQLAQYFYETHGMPLDKSGKDVSRACYVSYDPDAYLNEKSDIWKVKDSFLNLAASEDKNPNIYDPALYPFIKYEEDKQINDTNQANKQPGGSTEFKRKQNEDRVLYCIEQIERDKIDITDDYTDWQSIAFALSTLGSDARELFHRVSSLNPGYDYAATEKKFDDALNKRNKITTPAKFFEICKIYGILTSKPRTIAEAKEEQTANDLIGDEEHTSDYLKFGLWEYNGTYWSLDLKGNKYEISNFQMKILWHVETSDDAAYRLIAIKNIHGHTASINMNTDDFTSVGAFKKIVARKGNFLFKGSDVDLIRLSDKLQRDEKPTKLIKQLGYHRRGKFYAFANGIFDIAQDKWMPVDEYGIVSHVYYNDKDEPRPQNYFIPAMSKIFAEKDDLFANDKKFIFQQSETSFEDWSKQFVLVYGNQGQIALAFYLMSLNSDIIFKDTGRRFPILFIQGKRGSGKGALIGSIMKMFGHGQDQIMLGGATTVVGFMRKLSQFVNAIVWYDEYKNNLVVKIIESLKNIYDRIGYERGKKDNTFETESTPILSACMLSGQELPTVDPALFSRTILQTMIETKFTDEQRANFRALEAMEEKGLSSITIGLMKHRPWVEANYKKVFEAELTKLIKAVNNNEIEERMYKNYAALIATAELLSTKIDLPFNMVSFKEVCKQKLLEQFFIFKGSDDTTKFWEAVEYLFNNKLIHEEREFQLRSGYLFIRVQDIHQAYHRLLTDRKDPGALDKETLYQYLESDTKSFVAKRKKWFGGAQRWCLQFKYVELGIDLITANTQEELKSRYAEMNLQMVDDEGDQMELVLPKAKKIKVAEDQEISPEPRPTNF